ncbi:MAG TPA: isopeptide-forming domain-containing fimbrial protein [Anaerolineales bacterium]|nr:isopeptide-forming domain-containing fimbrial protein [Anaerolineales bacterium]
MPSNVTLGDTFSFTVTFDNNGTDPGYGPFLDLILPSNGADGDFNLDVQDGIVFVSATALGYTFNTGDDTLSVQTFPDPPPGPPPPVYPTDYITCVSHPWAVDSSNTPLAVCGPAGDQFVSLRLPFGSFTPDQPPLIVTVNAAMSNLADVNTPLTIRARGGYMFGTTPLDDWCCGDVSIVSPTTVDGSGWPSGSVSPSLMTIEKSYIGPGNTEDETASGPNYPRQYTITVDLASGQTFSDLTVTDYLPNTVQYIGVASITPSGFVIDDQPLTGAAQNPPNNDLVIRWPSITGAAGADISITVDFFVPRLNATSSPIIDPTSGDDTTSGNIAWAETDWTPLDSRDAPTSVSTNATCPACAPLHILQNKSIAIQKSVVNVTDGNVSPGDVLEYTLTFQVSDFFAFGSVVITDVISDGQRFDSSFTPTLGVNGNPYVLALAGMSSANFDVSCNYTGGPGAECTSSDPATNDGTTTLIFRVSDEIITRGQNGRMVGGCVNPVTGSPTPDCASYNDGPTTATLVFRTVIQDVFADDFPSGDPSVDQGDALDDVVTISGNVLDTSTFVSGQPESDNAVAGVSIGRETLAKSIYAVNGDTNPANWVTSGGLVVIKPLDTVTFRLTYGLNTSDVEDLSLVDYLPLPIFFVDDADDTDYVDPKHQDGPAWVFDDVVDGTVPAPGRAKFGPADTFRSYSGIVPTLSTSFVNNSLTFTYGDYDNPANESRTIDLLFTLTVAKEPFADQLFLTNEAHANEGSTQLTSSSADVLLQFILTQPIMSSSKGVVWTSSPSGVFSPSSTGPAGVTFLPPANAPRWTGTINSSGLASNPINSDLSGVDAGDIVTFAITLENHGTSLEGAFDLVIRDLIPDIYQIPAGGLNLQIFYGNGTGPISFVGLGSSCTGVWPGDPCGPDGLANTADDLFGNGIELVDPVGQGVCQAHDPNLGNNVILITYDLQVRPDVAPGDYINTEVLTNYASYEDGPSHIPSSSGTFPDNYPDTVWDFPIKDSATVSIQAAPTKYLVATSETSTAGADVAIGEIVRYRLVMRIPEGTSSNVQFQDLLPPGLIFLNDGSARVAFVSNNGITSTSIGTLPVPAIPPACNITGTTADGTTPPSSSITCVLADENIGSTNSIDANVDSYSNGTDPFFKLGSLTNTDSDDDEEFAIVEFNALVHNQTTAQNDAGDILNNSVRVFINDVQSGSDSTAVPVRVVEPAITFNKSIVSLPSPLDAGGVVQYRVTYANGTGSTVSTAFDVRITDTLPAQLTLNLPVTVTLAGGATGVTDNSSSTALDVAIASVPAGGSVTIDYTATIQSTVTAEEIITNTSTSTWTSLPSTGTTPNDTGSTTPGTSGSPTGERDGSSGIGGQPNDYIAESSQSFTVASPTISKQITATSAAHTTGTDVAIGEEITYDILLTFPEGTTPADTVLDDLPTGLEVVIGSPEVITTAAASGGVLTADFNGTIGTQSITVVAGDGGSVSYEFANVSVAGDNDTTNNTILLRFRARVTNVAANQAGTVISNEATNQVGTGTPVSSNSVTVTVVEPSITFEKTIVSLPSPLDAGGVVQYRISYVNGTGSTVSTALDVRITDTLPAQLTLNLPVTVTLAGGATGVTDNSSSTALDVTIASIPAGGSVTVDFSATIQSTVTPGEVINNISNSTWTSLSGDVGGERTGDDGPGGALNDYAATSSASFGAGLDLLFSKNIEGTDVTNTTDPDVVVGETVTFGLYVTLSEGTTPSLQVVDDLPDGMAYIDNSFLLVTTQSATACGSLTADFNGSVPSPSLTIDPPSGDSATLTIDFGAITVNGDNNPNNNTFLLCFEAVVQNVAANQDGTVLTNLATLEAGSTFLTDSADVNIVEPVLQITKVVNELFPIPNQTLTFTLTVEHAPSSTADAHDVLIFDDLPSNLTLNPASVVTTPSGGVAGITNNSAGNRVEVQVSEFPNGGSLTVQFEATFTGNLGDALTNLGNVTWTSTPDTNPNERTGGGGVNDYEASDEVGLAHTRELEKSLIASNHPNTTLPDVTIGEILTYQVVITLPANSTDTAIAIDTLDAGLAFMDCSDITAGPNVTSSTVDFTATGNCNPGTAPTNNPQIQNSGQVIRFDFGTVTNANPTDTETITMTYRVVVLDVVSNTGGVQLDNDIEWQYTTTSLTASAPQVTIREPDLSLVKTVDPTVALPGASVTYKLVVEHTGDSEADAFDLVLTDVIPDGLDFSGGAPVVTTLSGQAPDAVNYNALTRTLTVQWDTFLLGARSELEFTAQLSSTLSLGARINNEATLVWSSLPGDISAPQSTFNTASTERLYDPLNPADVYIVSSSALLTIPALPQTGFAPGRVTALPEQPDDLHYTALNSLWMEIPKLGVKVEIVGVPFNQTDWNLTWLGNQAGWLAGTAYPTHPGNSGITAHAYLANGLPGPFARLDQLRFGDQIILHLDGQRYIYEVRQNLLVTPSNLSVLKHEKYSWLTLITCKSYSETAGGYLYRVTVRAVLVKVEPDQ